MVNPITSRRPPLSPADVVALDEQVPGGLHSSWLEFLLRHNVGVPERAWHRARNLVVAHFFGISPLPDEDFRATLDRYDGRLAPRHRPIADAGQGHLICMDPQGRIHLWDQARHDRAVDDVSRVSAPVVLAPSLDAFLEALDRIPGRAGLPANPADAVDRVNAIGPADDVATLVSQDDFEDLFRAHKIDDAS